MSFYSLMNKYKWTETEQAKQDDYTHVSMFPYGGKYKIPNEDIEDFYNQYNLQIRAGAKYGILERPKDIGPISFGFSKIPYLPPALICKLYWL